MQVIHISFAVYSDEIGRIVPNPAHSDMSNGKIYVYIGFILALTDFQQIKEKNCAWHYISWPTEHQEEEKKRSEIIEDE